jgi:DNA-binding transcriptional MerR regulator
MRCHMTTEQLCQSAPLTPRELQSWLETGLLEPEMVGIPGGGRRRNFTADQLERARLGDSRKSVSRR